jgi:hypothetical protein
MERRGCVWMETKAVPAALFCGFAAASLTRWRALAGCAVAPQDSRWGVGRIRDIRWEGRSDRPDDQGSIYIRVEYAGDLRVRVHARAFGRIHRDVTIEASLADFVQRWYGTEWAASEENARAAALADCDRVLRERQDAEQKRRVEILRQRARGRGDPDPAA